MKVYKKIYRDIKKYISGTDDFMCLDKIVDNEYPLDFSFTLREEKFYYYPFDSNGIPYVEYESVGCHYNPTRVAGYCLAHYGNYLALNNEESKNIFLLCSDWFLSFKSGLYEYSFDWLDLRSPWISCMAQGQVASIMILAYKMTGNATYLEHAERSLSPFLLSIDEGGVQSKLSNGDLFLEEYPSKDSTHVLNGFLFALIAIKQFLLIKKSREYEILYCKLLESLKNNISSWCCYNGWSLYDLNLKEKEKNFSTPSYHNIHIAQLRWLADIEDDENLKGIVALWEKGGKSLKVRLVALVRKIFFRFFNKAQR